MSCVGTAVAEPVGARTSIALPARRLRPKARAPSRHETAFASDPPPATLAAIYDAGMAPERWPDVLAALAAGMGGTAATLHVGPAAGPCRITAAFGMGEDALRGYGNRCAALDPVIAGAAAKGAAWAAPTTVREAVGHGLERTAFFTGWMRPNGLDDLLCLGLLPPGASHHATVSVARPPRAPRFGPADAAVLARLAPHLRRAVEMHRRLSSCAQAKPTGPLADALDRLAAGVALLDAGGAVVWANRPAGLLLRAGDGLSLDRNGVLRPAATDTAEALRRLVAAAAAGAEGALPMPRPSGRAALALHAVPLPSHAAAERERMLPVAAPRPSVLLLLIDPECGGPDATLRRRLRAVYGLTAAEAAVAAHAAHGVGLPEVAQSLGLAVATARTHAQRVFSKAGVRGQAALARQVERLSLLRPVERGE